MKRTRIEFDRSKLPPVPRKIAAGRATWKDIDAWMLSFGAVPIPRREAARLRKAGRLGMTKK